MKNKIVNYKRRLDEDGKPLISSIVYHTNNERHDPDPDNPAVTYYLDDGRIDYLCHYKNGMMHRDHTKGPARIDFNVSSNYSYHKQLVQYIEYDELHRPRELGPAKIHTTLPGYKTNTFYENGKKVNTPDGCVISIFKNGVVASRQWIKEEGVDIQQYFKDCVPVLSDSMLHYLDDVRDINVSYTSNGNMSSITINGFHKNRDVFVSWDSIEIDRYWVSAPKVLGRVALYILLEDSKIVGHDVRARNAYFKDESPSVSFLDGFEPFTEEWEFQVALNGMDSRNK